MTQSTPNQQGAGGNEPYSPSLGACIGSIWHVLRRTEGVLDQELRQHLLGIRDFLIELEDLQSAAHPGRSQPQRGDVGGSESQVAPGLLAGVERPVPPTSAASDPRRVQMWDQKGTPPGETVWVSPVVHESEGQS